MANINEIFTVTDSYGVARDDGEQVAGNDEVARVVGEWQMASGDDEVELVAGEQVSWDNEPASASGSRLPGPMRLRGLSGSIGLMGTMGLRGLSGLLAAVRTRGLPMAIRLRGFQPTTISYPATPCSTTKFYPNVIDSKTVWRCTAVVLCLPSRRRL